MTTTHDDDSPWLTVREAAARAKVGRNWIYDAVRAGRLRAVRIGARDIRVHRFDRRDLDFGLGLCRTGERARDRAKAIATAAWPAVERIFDVKRRSSRIARITA